jgi:hypothetical protein
METLLYKKVKKEEGLMEEKCNWENKFQKK